LQLGIQTDGQHGRLRMPLRRPSVRCSSCHSQEPQVPPITADLAHQGQWRPRPVVQSRRGQQAAWLGLGGQVSRQHTVTGGRSAAASGIAVCPMSRPWESQQDSEPRPPGHSMNRRAPRPPAHCAEDHGCSRECQWHLEPINVGQGHGGRHRRGTLSSVGLALRARHLWSLTSHIHIGVHRDAS
jgi:hypothetical protein